MRLIILFLVAWLFIHTCHTMLHCATCTANATADAGREIGRRSSQIIASVRDGIGNDGACTIALSQPLQDSGLKSGKLRIGRTSSSDDDNDNKASVYLIFDKSCSRTVTARVLDVQGREYGRTSVNISGNAGEAKYCDIVFSDETDIENCSKIVLE